MPTYGSLITTAGDALIAAALSGGDPVSLATIAVGDANNTDVLPDPAQTALVNQRFEVSIASLSVDAENPNQIIATAIIPAEVGGWEIRELGVKTLDGTLFAISNFSAARKPVAAEGSVWVMELSVAIAIASTNVIQLTVNPDIDFATKQWVIDNFEPKGSGGAFVPITRSLVAGPGLRGGGSLAQDRTFSADPGWFDVRYAAVTHGHDERYARLDHGHGAAIAGGAAGFMTGADKAKLDGLGLAGMRVLAEFSASGVNFVDVTLPGPFGALVFDLTYSPIGQTDPGGGVYRPVELWGHIQDSQTGFPALSGIYQTLQQGNTFRHLRASPAEPSQVIGPVFHFSTALTGSSGPLGPGAVGNLGSAIGAGTIFASGVGANYVSGVTPLAASYVPPGPGEARYLRLQFVKRPEQPGAQNAILVTGGLSGRILGF